MKKLVIASAITLACASGCTKYQDGPLVDFQTLNARLVNDWVVDQVFKNTADTVTNQFHFEVNLGKDNNAYYVDTTFADSIPQMQIDSMTGTWGITDDNANVALFFNHNQEQRLWEILRITNNQFWVLEKVGNDYYQYNLKPKS